MGPPGTGKTDVAVQIISNLYHNFPAQRTLIVTHSNQALNQLFEKIMALDIDERHLLRLGHGEEALETEKDFSRSVSLSYNCLFYWLTENSLHIVENFPAKMPIGPSVVYKCFEELKLSMKHKLYILNGKLLEKAVCSNTMKEAEFQFPMHCVVCNPLLRTST